MNNDTVISIKGLTFSYSSEKKLLSDVSFELKKGEILSVIGQNGSGKTTLLKCLLGYYKNYSGEIILNNVNIKNYSYKEFARIVAYVPQLSEITFDYTVRDFVLMGRNVHLKYFDLPKKKDYDKVSEALSLLGIMHLSDHKINEISGGEKQLAHIARALVQTPQIILMDEPTSALDYGNCNRILSIMYDLKKAGYTIIFTCHNPEYPFLLNDKVLAIYKNGDFLFGQSIDVLTQEALTKLYGMNIKPIYIDRFEKWICITDLLSETE